MSYPITKTMREERRKVAQARNAEYNKLTLEQKLVAAKGRKQRHKLEAAIKLRNQRPAAKAK